MAPAVMEKMQRYNSLRAIFRSIIRFRGSLFPIFLWVLLALAIALPRLLHPAYGIQGDLPLHYHITRSFTQSFSEGDLSPRWAGLLDGGRGDALFTFYPPLSYLLSAFLSRFFGIEILNSLKIVTLLVLIIAQAGAYLLAREFYPRERSLIASTAYALLPAYPLIALHRAFFANALGLSLAPFALLGAYLLLTGKRPARGFAIFSLSFSAIILAHVITTYLCGVAIGLMAIVYALRFDRSRPFWRGIIRLAAAGLFVLALTAFFLWRQRAEMGWVQVGLQIVQQDYRNYFLFAQSPDDSRYRKAWADLNFITSLITLAQTVTALLLGLICSRLLFDRSRGDRNLIVCLSLAIALLGIIISLPASEPLWRYLPGLKFIQFPWRFQPFVALACGLLAAEALDGWKTLGRRSRMLISATLTWAIIACFVFTFMLVRLREPGISREQIAEWLISSEATAVSIEEGRRLQNEDDLKYLPYSGNQIYFRPHGSDFNLYPPVDRPGGASFVSGGGRIIEKKLEIAHREFTAEAAEPSRMRVETYNYPHWIATVDGGEVKIDSDNQGLMLIDVPAGTHQVTFSYSIRDRSQVLTKYLSASAWLIFAAWIVVRIMTRVKRLSK